MHDNEHKLGKLYAPGLEIIPDLFLLGHKQLLAGQIFIMSSLYKSPPPPPQTSADRIGAFSKLLGPIHTRRSLRSPE